HYAALFFRQIQRGCCMFRQDGCVRVSEKQYPNAATLLFAGRLLNFNAVSCICSETRTKGISDTVPPRDYPCGGIPMADRGERYGWGEAWGAGAGYCEFKKILIMKKKTAPRNIINPLNR
ncbi:MAG TPA: hypothetical protein VEW69_11120, partial [Alphaproteobacteria bacterium]|nr:hypothetical protein [Alphaproteobacteria bacterium]